MNKRDVEVLKKILTHARRIMEHSRTCRTYEDFADSELISDACIFNIMQIGELAKTELSEEAKTQIGTIPWKKIYGMRNRIVHGYSYVDMRIIWDTIFENIPELVKEMTAVLESAESS